MSKTTSTTNETEQTSAVGRSGLWWPGVALAGCGAVAAFLVAVVSQALGTSLETGGEAIPLSGFATLAFVFSLVGVTLAAACRRWARHPALAFQRIALALLVLSFVPDLTLPDIDTATRITLIASHLAVAVIVIPGIKSRLPE